MIILFALIFGWGGNGFGGGNNAALTEAGMCGMNNFTQLENAVGRLNDSIAQQNMMLSNGMCNLGYQNLEQFSNLQRDLCTGFANGVAATNAVGAQMQQCCCETQRAIDGVNYNVGQQSFAMQANDTANTQKVLDALCDMRMEMKNDQISQMASRINQLELNQAVGNVVRYPTSFAYTAGNNPFCGCNGCC
jgi:hypothetical protein